MTRIYLIRHAEAEGNLYRRIHGWYDGAVTAMGFKQIEALRRRFENIKIDSVYSSDLKRARMTAAAIYAPKNLPLTQLSELREVNMGTWEDRCWGEVEHFYPEQTYYLSFSPDKWQVEGCESYTDSLNRIRQVINNIACDNEGKSVAVVSHGSIIRILLADIFGYRPSEINKVLYCDNTAVSLLTAAKGHLSIDYFNDNTHLPAEISAFHREVWWKSEDGRDGRNMYFLPMDVFKSGDLYLRRYRDTWIQSHGHDGGFTAVYLDWARKRSRENPQTVMEAYLDGTPCGMLELAASYGASEGAGHISFLYLEKEYRGKGLAVQLIGQAQSFYKSLGRDKLRLRVTEANKRALQFYQKYGFRLIDKETSQNGSICVMEKSIN
jgi:probable phosphoglycerate mutase